MHKFSFPQILFLHHILTLEFRIRVECLHATLILSYHNSSDRRALKICAAASFSRFIQMVTYWKMLISTKRTAAWLAESEFVFSVKGESAPTAKIIL